MFFAYLGFVRKITDSYYEIPIFNSNLLNFIIVVNVCRKKLSLEKCFFCFLLCITICLHRSVLGKKSVAS